MSLLDLESVNELNIISNVDIVFSFLYISFLSKQRAISMNNPSSLPNCFQSSSAYPVSRPRCSPSLVSHL